MRVSSWFGKCVWCLVVAAFALSLTTLPNTTMANGVKVSKVATAIKQAVPKAGEQLLKGAKLAFACGAVACMLGVALLAVQAEQQVPPAEAQATPTNTTVPFIPFTGSWYAGPGAYTDSFGDFATFDVGFKGKGNFRWPGIKDEKGSADLFFLTSFRFKPEEVDTLDAAQVLPVTYAFGKVLLFDRGEGELSYGYSDTAIAALMNSLWPQHMRNYVMHYKKGPINFAAVGHEYFDNILRVVETDDPVRGSHVSLYRGGLEQYIPVSNNVLLQGKLESALGLGDIFGIDLGGVKQDRIAAVLDAAPGMGGAEISNSLYHEGSARLMAILAQGRYIFFVNALHGTTIDGLIESNDTEVGDFRVSNDGIEVYGKIGLTDNLAIEGFYGWYGQNVELTAGGQEIAEHQSDGHLGAAVFSWSH